jgi:glycine dehydrogenase
LPISWAYVRLMGPEGLTQATKSAVLSANYIAARLDEHYPVLYTGETGLVAHECILDLREITKATGVTVDDVAKRLIDYGFHARPTRSARSPLIPTEPPTPARPRWSARPLTPGGGWAGRAPGGI